MNTNLARTTGVMDGWPILVACAIYAIVFYIFAMTITSVFPVA